MNNIVQKQMRTKEKIVSAALQPIQKLLPCKLIEQRCRDSNYTWRERDFGAAVTLLACLWKHLHAALKSARSTEDFLYSLDPKTTSNGRPQERDGSDFCKARARLPEAVFKWAAEHAGGLASQTFASSFHGMPVWLADGTTLRTPNTPELETCFGRSRNATRSSRSPLIRLVLLVCMGTGAVLHLASGAYALSEQALFLQLLASIPSNDLLVADRGYASFLFFWLMRKRGAHVLTRLHGNRLVHDPQRTLGYRDTLHAWRRPHPASSKWPELQSLGPAFQEVRVIERTIIRKGYRPWTLRIVTTLTDPVQYPADELIELYLRRWDVETTLRTLKTHGHMARLTGKTPDIVRKEIYSAVLAHNCVAALMAESGEAPELLSTTRAREIVMLYSGHMAFAATVLLPGFYKEMLRMIATALQMPQPRGPQPRAIIQRPSTFPVLMTSRLEWKIACRAS